MFSAEVLVFFSSDGNQNELSVRIFLPVFPRHSFVLLLLLMLLKMKFYLSSQYINQSPNTSTSRRMIHAAQTVRLVRAFHKTEHFLCAATNYRDVGHKNGDKLVKHRPHNNNRFYFTNYSV